LDDEHIGAADVLVDLKRHFGVGKSAKPALPQRNSQMLRDLAGQLRVSAPREQFQFSVPCNSVHFQVCEKLAGAGGFEPPNTGSKVPRLTAWPRPNELPAASHQLPVSSVFSFQFLATTGSWRLRAGSVVGVGRSPQRNRILYTIEALTGKFASGLGAGFGCGRQLVVESVHAEIDAD